MKNHCRGLYTTIYSIIVFCFFISIISAGATGLKGTYTIDPGSPASLSNYTSFNDADSDLVYGSRSSGAKTNGPGVSGAVLFKVADGTYNEDVHIPYITGVSSKNTISFLSAKGDSSKVIISSSSTGTYFSPAYVVHLDSASYISFHQITFLRTSGSYYDHVVIVNNFSNFNSFSNCQILGCYTPSSTTVSCMLIFSGFDYYKGYSQDQYNVFRNNYMKNGYDGIYWTGALTGGAAERGNVFDHNTIDSCGYYGLILVSEDSVTVTSNKINMPNGNIGIYAAFVNDPYLGKHGPFLITNNFISIGNSTLSNGNNAMALSYIDSAYIAFNNTNVYGGSTYGSCAANITPSGMTNSIFVYNNNFINQNTSPSDFVFSSWYLTDVNYNNMFCGSNSLITYDGTTYNSLAKWKASGLGLGAKDTSLDPLYNSTSDLHVSAPGLNNAATPLSYVSVDIDNEKRNSTNPDIGADEFTPPALFPACIKILNPTTGFCSGKQDVKVLLYNKGTDTIKSATIEWSINGTSQTAYSWTGTLTSGASILLNIGTYNFTSTSSTYTISCYPGKANGTAFVSAASNSVSSAARSGINGAFTIDPAGSGSTNYISFRSAVNDLNLKGLCGATTFTVVDGTYNESVEIDEIPGASASNTVTFQSKSRDSSKVILDTAWGSTNYYAPGHTTVNLNGADWVTFQRITIVNQPASIFLYANAIELNNSANHNNFNNCVIAVSTNTNTSYGIPVFFNLYSTDEFNMFKNNIISGGYYSILCWPTTGVSEKGNVFWGNIIDSAVYISTELGFQDSFTFSNNKLSIETGNLCMQLYYISGNSSSEDSSMICNNFINFKPIAGSAVISYFSDKLNFYNNSIISNSIGINNPTVLFYSYPAKRLNLVNNIVYNTAGGSLFDLDSTGVTYSDYNDWYTSGTVYGTWNSSTTCNSLADLQKASRMEVHSVSADPKFKFPAHNDLHLTSLSFPLEEKGVFLSSNLRDIDNELRSKKTNIGADETHFYLNDAAIISIDSPSAVFCSNTKDIYVRLFNAGKSTLSTATVNWSVDGTTKSSYSWKGSLASFSSALVKVGSLTFTSGIEKRIKSWTSQPNGVNDSNTLNDSFTCRKSMGLNGTFTIGGASPDYTTFREAAFALNNFGVCGKVTFNVRNGYYNESVDINKVAGTSATNTITFQSSSLNASGVVLDTSWSTTTAFPGSTTGINGHTLQINGTNNISFLYMTISNFGTGNNGFADVVEMYGGSSFNTFDHDILLADTINNSTEYGSVIYNDYYTSENFNTVSYSKISGGKYGLFLYDYYPATETGNMIYANTITNSSACGIYTWYQDSLVIDRNNISLSGNIYPAIELYYISQSAGGGDSTLIANNMISTFNTDTNALYIYNNNAQINVYNNSIYSLPNTSYNYCVYVLNYNSGIIRYADNVIMNDNSGPVLYSNLANYSDYNDWYTAGASLASWDGTICPSLSFLQSTNSMDAYSISANPMYNDPSSGNLHATSSSSSINGTGIPLTAVTVDIDGQMRNPNHPDMGADEFNTFKNDIGISGIVLQGNNCGRKNTVIKVTIHNYGINAQSKFNVDVDVIKGTKVSVKTAFPGIIKADSDAIIFISFSPALNTQTGGSFTFKAYTDLSPDNDHSNDTLLSSFTFTTSPVANFTISNGCPNDVAQLSDSSTTSSGKITGYVWNIGKGNKFNTSKLTFVFAKGKTTVMLAVTNSLGCSDTIIRKIDIERPDSSFNYHITPDGNVKFSANDTTIGRYTWDYGDLSAHSSGDPVNHKYSDGRYTATMIVTDSNGCSTQDTSSFTILISGINFYKQFENNSISIFPNPANQKIFFQGLDLNSGDASIRIYDITGKLLNSYKNVYFIDVSSYPAGSYLIEMQQNQNITRMKVSVER